jgi:NAD(P)-dependent dehydrogenase (short-subunit alcohol dehydrogenase family)
MLTAGGGAIVNTASRVALVGKATTPVYSAAKHGVIGLTRSAAIEFAAQGIRINAVCPGFIRTELVAQKYGDKVAAMGQAANPLHRAGDAREVAEAAVWLASPAASFVVGVALPVDGGATA